MQTWKEKVKLLLVDDSKDDAFFIRRVLDKVGVGQCVHVVEDGEEAIQYLRGENGYDDRDKFPFPNVIVSDLNMPRMNGFELLRWVRQHPECMVIPTIMLSSSSQDSDVIEAYRLGANAYLTKPHASDELEKVIRTTCEFWSICERPAAKGTC